MGKLHPLRGITQNDDSWNSNKINPNLAAEKKKEFDFKNKINLTNHDKELSEAEEAIEGLKVNVIEAVNNNTLNDNVHLALYEGIIKVLDYTGRLSMQVFDINEELENLYLLKYKKSPAMAKELWLNHYDYLHRPYSLIKNRCFKLLDKLDYAYIDKFKKNPPNWNP